RILSYSLYVAVWRNFDTPRPDSCFQTANCGPTGGASHWTFAGIRAGINGYNRCEMATIEQGNQSDMWEPGVTSVIGHRHPDTDAVAAALGYAWHLTARGDASVRAARAGPLTEQTAFALERLRQEAPTLLMDAAPTFGH